MHSVAKIMCKLLPATTEVPSVSLPKPKYLHQSA